MKIITEDVSLNEVSSGRKANHDIQNLLQDHVTGEDLGRSQLKPSPAPPGISELTPYMYVCGAGATRPSALEALGVSAVINAAAELPDTPLPDNITPLYLRVNVEDRITGRLDGHFDEVGDVIEQTRLAGGRTLVHCVAGVSRSVSLCIAYLIKYQGMSLRNAFLHVRSKRTQARPNTGFFRQLIDYEVKLLGTNSVKMVYNEAACSEIPDVYEEDYKAMLWYQKHYNRNFGRR